MSSYRLYSGALAAWSSRAVRAGRIPHRASRWSARVLSFSASMHKVNSISYMSFISVTNISDSETWQKMASIKSSILRRMDTAPAGVRICCIKFVARVVQVQTPGMISDPRKPEQNEISLALLPRDHPNIPPANLEAEASGLLDRLLGVLQDNESDAVIVTATLNSLSSLVQRRASISNKILSTVLSYNPLTLTNTPMSPRDRVLVKSCTRTTMSFLLNVLKRYAIYSHYVDAVANKYQESESSFGWADSTACGAPEAPLN